MFYKTSCSAVLAGACTNQVAWNGRRGGEDGCQDWYSPVDVQVKMGNSYYICIGGWQAATGSGTLTIE